jgi:hypothetical protein
LGYGGFGVGAGAGLKGKRVLDVSVVVWTVGGGSIMDGMNMLVWLSMCMNEGSSYTS